MFMSVCMQFDYIYTDWHSGVGWVAAAVAGCIFNLFIIPTGAELALSLL